ncbi:hypothetical protein M441DRAFT_54383 [Trichoderma asperellum CBS 433.97]|uniref:Uncharacterized protein n=1 Tax=Trichoderma asperellum (strain ATCC 204424 / CBS 433.97 / NBRC 101777) TaxID=1042311 RepID=A0A2T3ZKI6_TRIA4|nr:hypothetical protein M441DRAFT_54383 [Trichoderma asperellum CBS 433.97]PTB45320.1 hypothetical protein M441DRAFT_54383 [Trichoderma asperellum CBS 433.97]
MPYYIWTTLRTMPPISFPIIKRYLPCQSISLLCVQLSIIQAFCRRWHDDFHIISSSNQSVACQMSGVARHDQHRPRSITVLRCLGFPD